MKEQTPKERIGRAELEVRPVGIRRLADDVVDQIRALIVAEGLEEGIRLPSEREFAQMFRTSRTVVSQALRALSLMGLVEIRPGSGAYVNRDPKSMITASLSLLLDMAHGSMTDLAELRYWLERLGANEALRAGDGGALELATAFDHLRESARRPASWIATDAIFHATIVAAARNPYLTALYESVHTSLISIELAPWVRGEHAPQWLSDNPVAQLALHESIWDALRRRDQDALSSALLAHHVELLSHIRTLQPVGSSKMTSRNKAVRTE